MQSVLTLILGGGRGNRLFPLTWTRSKPAVPIGGKYRLIDVPVSNCLHANLRRIFVLTQFNSASLNRHVAQSYRLDHFSQGFVDILAAEQTPDSTSWFQGTADAVRQAWRHFNSVPADHILILAGDHLYRMNLGELINDHIEQDAEVTIAAQPCDPETSTQMGIFLFDGAGQISGFEEKPDLERLGKIGQSVPRDSRVANVTSPSHRRGARRPCPRARLLLCVSSWSIACGSAVEACGRHASMRSSCVFCSSAPARRTACP